MPAKTTMGRPPNDSRGSTKGFMFYLLPSQKAELEDLAASKGFFTASRMIARWVDQGCRGVRS